MLKESESQFASSSSAMIPVEGWKVGQAYKRAILGRKPAAFTKLSELPSVPFRNRSRPAEPHLERPRARFSCAEIEADLIDKGLASKLLLRGEEIAHFP